MAGVKGKSGGKRIGSGPKKKPHDAPCKICNGTDRYKIGECKACSLRRARERRLKLRTSNPDAYKEKISGYQRRCYLKNKIKNVDKQLKRLYGLTIEDWSKMYETQNGSCFICKKHQNDMKIRLSVDHCHSTGVIRSLLCPKCNNAVAAYENHGEAVMKYLEIFK